ncbi:MAG: LruC domain-containing protein, partial [Muribaculaceae bacterium]|nr:LruC domain-containing protein [Muribaculaceae bacterium]
SYTSGWKNYPDDDYNDEMIFSHGIRISEFLDEEAKDTQSIYWYLDVLYRHDNGVLYYISESPFRNMQIWHGGAYYYDVPLRALNNAYVATCHIPISRKSFCIYDYKNENCSKDDKFKEFTYDNASAVLIGFNTGDPTSAASIAPSEFFDAVFLFIPSGRYYAGGGGTTASYGWTIAAEDLGATDDWDFNDAVFTFTDIIRDLNTENIGKSFGNTREWGPRDAEPVRVISVQPEAAGGTMPLYITYTGKASKLPEIPNGSGVSANTMYSEANNALKQFNAELADKDVATYIVGKEIHAWLGADSYTTMFNTGENRMRLKTTPVEFAIPLYTKLGVGLNPYSGIIEAGSLMGSVVNKTLCGFAVLVDRGNSLGVDAMNETEGGLRCADGLVLGRNSYVIGKPDASNGEIAPQMILINSSYWLWPQERVKISDAYPDFAAWLADPSVVWTNNSIKDKVTH